jgi:hypothetical protein
MPNENNQNDGNAITLVLPLQPLKCRIVPFDGIFDFGMYLYYHVNMPTKTKRRERGLEIPTLDKT